MENIGVVFGARTKDGLVWQLSPAPIETGTYIVVSDEDGNTVEGVVVFCSPTAVDDWRLEVRPDWSSWMGAPPD
jgi:hypothetical protein